MFLFMFHNQIITCYYYRTNCYAEVSIRRDNQLNEYPECQKPKSALA